MKGFLLTALACAAIAAALALPAAADVGGAITVSAPGTFSNVTAPAGNDAAPIYCGGGAPQPTCQSLLLPQPGTQVRWGAPLTLTGVFNKSGLGWSGAANAAANVNVPFRLGSLTHFNLPVKSGTAANGVRTVQLSLVLATPSGSVLQDMAYPLVIDETANEAPCAYPGNTVCPDKITWSTPTPTVIHAGGNAYVLNVDGFQTGGTPSTGFISEEGGTNVADLFARVVDQNEQGAAKDDAYSAAAGSPLVVDAAHGVGANDTGTSDFSVATGVAHGTLLLNADGSFTYEPAAGFLGDDSFVYLAHTSSGAFALATARIDVTDQTPPVISVTGSGPVEATSPAGADVPYVVTAHDAVSGDVAASCTPAPGTFPVGRTDLTCTATDAAGNEATATTFAVIVTDTTAPVLHVPGPLTAEAGGPDGAAVHYVADATDIVDGDVVPVCTPAPDSAFARGTTDVTCTATDAHGNAVTDGFAVHVVDTTPPRVDVPADVTVDATSSAGVVVTYPAATATDLVDGALAATCSPASGSPFPIRVTTVSCEAKDAAGNTGTASFSVTVRDRREPVLTLPASLAVDQTTPAGATVTYAVSATDDVDPAPGVVCRPASGTVFAPGDTTVSCTATDAAGNAATGTFRVHVRDVPEQLTALIARVVGVGPGASLEAKLRGPHVACSSLEAFIAEVRAQSGKKIPAATATSLIADATRIRGALGC